ncbi:MAG: hypothetical protein JRI67_11560 [Deltaproteobacteria bacterium]|nr:hypothetical protein [Deltaproteobacteria bacterium]
MTRKLMDIEMTEVSFVDEPANKRKFLFFKAQDSKGDIVMDNELLELMKAYFGDDAKLDFEKAEEISDKALKAIKDALKLINKYRADFPDDLKKAVGVLAKYAGYGYGYPAAKGDEEDKSDIEKAGAKFSKDTLEKLKKAVEALDALKAILPDIKEETKKSKEDSESPESSEAEEVLAKLAKSLEELEAKKSQEDKLSKTLEELAKRLEIVEKGTGVKKSIEGQDEDSDEEDSDVDDPWPSLRIM